MSRSNSRLFSSCSNRFTLSRNEINAIAFFLIGLSACALQAFFSAIANSALGRAKNTSVMFMALYVPQVTLCLCIDYWTKWLSYHTRIAISTLLFTIAMLILYSYIDESTCITGDCLIHPSRILVIFATVLNGIATTIASVTALGYCTFYHGQCTNMLSFGAGFGGLLGAFICFVQNHCGFTNKGISVTCIIFPLILAFSYFFMLKHPINGLKNYNDGDDVIIHGGDNNSKNNCKDTKFQKRQNAFRNMSIDDDDDEHDDKNDIGSEYNYNDNDEPGDRFSISQPGAHVKVELLPIGHSNEKYPEMKDININHEPLLEKQLTDEIIHSNDKVIDDNNSKFCILQRACGFLCVFCCVAYGVDLIVQWLSF